jgi:hypothetical protein
MEETEALELIRGVKASFNLKTKLGRETTAEWLKDLIPMASESVSYLKEYAKDNCDPALRNFSKTVKAGYRQWLSRQGGNGNGDQAVSYRRVSECVVSDCNDGLLHVWGKDTQQYVFRCATCNRSTLRGIPAASLMNLIHQGYEPESLEVNIERYAQSRAECAARNGQPERVKRTTSDVVVALGETVKQLKVAQG